MLRSDGKQCLDRFCGRLESQELELDSRKNQAQFYARWATLHRHSSNGLSLRISKVLQQELSKCEVGSGAARFFRHCLPQQIFGLHVPARRRVQPWERRGGPTRSPVSAKSSPLSP